MNKRKPVIAANWKMNKTSGEGVEFVEIFAEHLENDDYGKEIIIIPPYTQLDAVNESLVENDVTDIISLGAQNMHWEESGAFTGEISADMLIDIGCEYVVIGHSERRQYFHETDETVAMKLTAAFKSGLIPILCIGEKREQRETGEMMKVIESQLGGALGGFEEADLTGLIIAYEPVWAIGTGLTATPEQAQEVHDFIRGKVKSDFSATLAESIRIIYGGSVKPSNVRDLMDKADIDGALVGGASLEPGSFFKLISFDK